MQLEGMESTEQQLIDQWTPGKAPGPGRPPEVFSPAKLEAAIDALNAALKSEKLPFALKIRACELLFIAYGLIPYTSLTKAERKTVKEFVREKVWEQQIKEHIQQKREAERKDAERQALDDTFAAVLN